MPKRHGCASIMVLGRFKRKGEAGGRWSLKLRKHITNKQRIGENEYESDTNSPIRRTRGSDASGNAASRTGCERSSHQGSRRLGQSSRLENAGRLHEGCS